ncbi:MAG TPA: ABC transporter [Acidimicrobiaceae bacterium]|nr:ABC transporter [Acidimicrobiaceae bacterium]
MPADTGAPAGVPAPLAGGAGLTRPVGLLRDIATVARRAVRSIAREPEFLGPALAIPLFFFVVNVGALESFAEASPVVFDYRAFQLPVAIVFAVTGISRASTLVTDIHTGYLDRMLVTPVRRTTLLFGLMVADIVMAVGLAAVVLAVGFVYGVRFETGIAGIAVFAVLSVLWSLAFTGFPYTVALRTGNPAAVNSAFLIFFPFAFLTPAFLPRELMRGWLPTVAAWNPVTYLLEGMRSLLSPGWDGAALGKAALAIIGLGLVTFTAAFRSLSRRVATG